MPTFCPKLQNKLKLCSLPSPTHTFSPFNGIVYFEVDYSLLLWPVLIRNLAVQPRLTLNWQQCRGLSLPHARMIGVNYMPSSLMSEVAHTL